MTSISPECLDMIALSLVPGLGPLGIKRLIERAESPENILRMDVRDIAGVPGISRDMALRIKKAASSSEYRDEVTYLRKNGIKVLCPLDKDYPQSLKDIYDPPSVLYIRGEMTGLGEKAVALVGSRRASLYGLRVSGALARSLAERGVSIISGLAAGIDSAAHRGAIAARGRTFAVIGGGLRYLSRSSSSSLADNISDSGAVITEFSSRTVPSKATFPRRNRIISGLSKAVVVVEAARKSGALITADFALEQGREVLAVPGPVDSITSFGSNRLIQHGAKLVTSAGDIFEELGMDRFLKGKCKGTPDKREKGDLTELHRKIMDHIESSGEGHIDHIAVSTGVEVKDLHDTLLSLQLRGKVKLLPGFRFEVPLTGERTSDKRQGDKICR